ncbi:MAG: hypothetical protein WAU16_16280 [Rhizobiaceae bacterium]|nr:hypothetical protein [Novosphingobium sp.]MBP7608412.1 hypothetical protein [Steroidobacteraceae bacterium]MBP8671900.1 hypothetical protein [Sphingobium sp.]HQW19778.1 hypothetical protein [Rhodocyclaceae bacterium]
MTLFNTGLSITPGNGHFTVFATAWNLFDKVYLASRVDGMAAGQPRTIAGGVRLRY